MDIVSKKICRNCGEEKCTTKFSKHGGTADKLDNRCKECVKLVKEEWKKTPQKLYPILPFKTDSEEWQVGKPTGSVFYRKNMNSWSAVIKYNGKQISKTITATKKGAEEELKIWLKNKSDEFGITRNRIRMVEKGGNVIEVKLTKDQTMITDLKFLDICQQYMLCSTKSGGENKEYYCAISLKKNMCGFHNFITKYKFVDHINRNTLDNRLINLRDSSPKQNNNNQNISKFNTSGFTGIRYVEDRPGGAWSARIKQDGKEYTKSFSIKKFGDEKAKQMAIEYRKELNKKFNCQNGEDIVV